MLPLLLAIVLLGAVLGIVGGRGNCKNNDDTDSTPSTVPSTTALPPVATRTWYKYNTYNATSAANCHQHHAAT